MLMQMLEAGGLPALTDGERTADGDSPKGYYECERASWTIWSGGFAIFAPLREKIQRRIS